MAKEGISEETNELIAEVMADNAVGVQRALDKGADAKFVAENGAGLLNIVKSADVAKLLINAGADPNSKGVEGNTPLHRAEDHKIAKLLIDAGADVNAPNDLGHKPIVNALLGENEKNGVASELFKSKDIRITDEDIKTAEKFFKSPDGVVNDLKKAKEQLDSRTDRDNTASVDKDKGFYEVAAELINNVGLKLAEAAQLALPTTRGSSPSIAAQNAIV